jgi:hypothetical protein
MDSLPFTQFDANLTVNKTTKVTSFIATKGYYPQLGLEPLRSMISNNPRAHQ